MFKKIFYKRCNSLFVFTIVIFITACQKQPSASFTMDKDTYNAGEVVHCKNTSADAYNWKWTTSDGGTSSSENFNYTININDTGGTKIFTLEAFSKNGSKISSITKSVTVIKCGQISVPKSFTPNNDGKDDFLCASINCLQMLQSLQFTIYNRWGEKVFEYSGFLVPSRGAMGALCWDGTDNSNQPTSGSYVYILNAEFKNGVKTSKKGTISIIK